MASFNSVAAARELKVAASTMGTRVLHSIKSVIVLTSPPGVNRRSVTRKGHGAKYIWKDIGFHNLSEVLDALVDHDKANKTDLLEMVYDVYVEASSKPKPKRVKRKYEVGGVVAAPAPAPVAAPAAAASAFLQHMSPNALRTGIFGLIDVKIESYKVFADLLEAATDWKSIAENPHCPEELKDLIKRSQTSPEIADLEAIMAIESLSPGMRAETAARLATVRANLAGSSGDHARLTQMVQATIGHVGDQIEMCKRTRRVF